MAQPPPSTLHPPPKGARRSDSQEEAASLVLRALPAVESARGEDLFLLRHSSCHQEVIAEITL